MADIRIIQEKATKKSGQFFQLPALFHPLFSLTVKI